MNKDKEEVLEITQQTLDQLYDVKKKLHDAITTSRWDTFFNSLVLNLIKKDQVNEIEAAFEDINANLVKLNKELAEIGQVCQLDKMGMDWLSDILFDNLFADRANHKKLEQSQQAVETMIEALETIQGKY